MASPRLNVTLPAHNEATQIATSIGRVIAFLKAQGWDWELVIAENGSSDGTAERAESSIHQAVAPRHLHQVRVLRGTESGRGQALRTAWLTSNADVLCYMDVDLSTDLACLPGLIEPLLRDEADLTIGSRLLPASRTTRRWLREILSRTYNGLLRWALGWDIRDAQCGFKAITREAALSLLREVRDQRWFFDTELLWLAQQGGWRVREVPVVWVDDPGTTVKLVPTIWQDLCGIWRLRRAGACAPVRRRPTQSVG